LPTLDEYDCRPYHGGTESETCAMENAENATWFFGVHGFTSGSYSIAATLQ